MDQNTSTEDSTNRSEGYLPYRRTEPANHRSSERSNDRSAILTPNGLDRYQPTSSGDGESDSSGREGGWMWLWLWRITTYYSSSACTLQLTLPSPYAPHPLHPITPYPLPSADKTTRRQRRALRRGAETFQSETWGLFGTVVGDPYTWVLYHLTLRPYVVCRMSYKTCMYVCTISVRTYIQTPPQHGTNTLLQDTCPVDWSRTRCWSEPGAWEVPCRSYAATRCGAVMVGGGRRTSACE